MDEIRYKFTCGCVVGKEGTIMINHRIRCREHWNRMVCRLVVCLKCNEVFEAGPAATRAQYCPKCRKDNDNEKRRAWQLARRKTVGDINPARHTQAKPAKWKPKPLNFDIPVPGWRPDLNKAPCLQCNHIGNDKKDEPCKECAWPGLYADSICDPDLFSSSGGGYGGLRSTRILNPTMS